MSDEAQIDDVIQTYFECMYESSADKARAVFHPNAKITGYLEDGLHQLSVDEFAEYVASQQPSDKDKGEAASYDVVSLDVVGATAVARVHEVFGSVETTTFMDILSLLKVDGRWSIYNKLFHVAGPTD